jgi:hypothetical protein
MENLKDGATSTSDRHEILEVDTMLDGQFWQQVRYVMQFSQPIYSVIRFADIDQLVIGEVYEQMDNMLRQIKDIVEMRDTILYDHVHKHVVKGGIIQLFHSMP